MPEFPGQFPELLVPHVQPLQGQEVVEPVELVGDEEQVGADAEHQGHDGDCPVGLIGLEDDGGAQAEVHYDELEGEVLQGPAQGREPYGHEPAGKEALDEHVGEGHSEEEEQLDVDVVEEVGTQAGAGQAVGHVFVGQQPACVQGLDRRAVEDHPFRARVLLPAGHVIEIAQGDDPKPVVEGLGQREVRQQYARGQLETRAREGQRPPQLGRNFPCQVVDPVRCVA